MGEERRENEAAMEPDEASRVRFARDKSPDEPGGADAEGHAVKVRHARDKSPDNPGGADTEGHMPVKWKARDESPDEPQQRDDDEKPGPDEAGKFRV